MLHLPAASLTSSSADGHLLIVCVCSVVSDFVFPSHSGMVSDTDNRVIITLGAPAGLPHNETTFAALLKKQGYTTAVIGEKWPKA